MTGMLASVSSLEEAKLVLAERVDIIDLKDPALGSLGALEIEAVKELVQVIAGKCATSATIGDLPMQPELIFNAVMRMAETGVNYVKVGFFPSANKDQVISKLAPITPKINLIAVLFADVDIDFKIIDMLITAGFKGVMLDTQDKAKGSLTGIMAKAEIGRFVGIVKSSQTICGLAGSLTLDDIPVLTLYRPDYLGFRGALCDQNDRVRRLSPQAVKTIKQAISEFSC
jgi:(5-formylfuran-3-yl)methyl phosphate synthase